MKKLFLSFSLLLAACETNQIVDPNVTDISLTVRNLLPLEGAHYQLWATFFQFNKAAPGDGPMHEGEFVSLGEFVVAQDGSLRSLSGGEARFGIPAGSNPQLLRDVVIAVQAEHADGMSKLQDSEPGSILIGGAFTGDAVTAVADLHIGYLDAFQTDFVTASGKCMIVCPTSPADSNSGVWFIESNSPPSPGLKNFPRMPPEWRYEGWVAQPDTGGGGPTFWSTGKFTRADSADLDGPGSGAGAGTPYGFPGQDFVNGTPSFNNLLMGGYSFWISIEPHPDNSAEPFFLTLLSSARVLPPLSGRTFILENVIGQSAPTARIVIKR